MPKKIKSTKDTSLESMSAVAPQTPAPAYNPSMNPMPSSNQKIVPVLVVLLIISSFLIGSMYTRIKMLESGASAGKNTANAANNGKVAGAAAANNPPAAQVAPVEQPVDVDLGDSPVLGDKNAKVAVVEYTDYQCPFCGQLFNNALPQIKKDYVDPGKVKLIVKDFPLTAIHPYAQKAAEAANCANEQGKFWEMHDTLFKNQTALTIDNLKKYAADLGLNTGNFTSCLDSGKFADKIKSTTSEGEKIGVRGTPASFVGKVSGNVAKQAISVSGAQPYDNFKTAIETALK